VAGLVPTRGGPLRSRIPAGAWNTFEENGQRFTSNSTRRLPASEIQETWSPSSSTTAWGISPTNTGRSAIVWCDPLGAPGPISFSNPCVNLYVVTITHSSRVCLPWPDLLDVTAFAIGEAKRRRLRAQSVRERPVVCGVILDVAMISNDITTHP
jgi:hypothetical protein